MPHDATWHSHLAFLCFSAHRNEKLLLPESIKQVALGEAAWNSYQGPPTRQMSKHPAAARPSCPGQPHLCHAAMAVASVCPPSPRQQPVWFPPKPAPPQATSQGGAGQLTEVSFLKNVLNCCSETTEEERKASIFLSDLSLCPMQ